MYKLRDFMLSTLGLPAEAIASDEVFCSPTDAESTLLTNTMQDTLDCYTFTLVTAGRLVLTYNSMELTFIPGDVYIYTPGLSLSIVSVSADYSGLCLMADEQVVLGLPVVRSVIRAAYFPLVQLKVPKLHLSPDDAARLGQWMRQSIGYLHSDHLFKDESMRSLLTLFLLDLMDIMEHSMPSPGLSERTESLFVGFLHLLPLHFVEHHDIAFYADRLHISTTYLSRIVRQVTGRTVADYVGQMLLMEASWLLKTTDLGIAAIAERLHFADQSSFGRFFTRLKGVSPKAYRMGKFLS